MFFFPLPCLSQTHFSVILALWCANSVHLSPPTSNPHLKTNLSLPPPARTERPVGSLPSVPYSHWPIPPFPPFLLMHYGYLKLVQHDIISFWELPEKSKLQNQSCRRSSWDFITSIACLHEYLSFLTDPICHNSCLSREREREKKKKRRGGKKKIHSLKLMYNSCQCFLAWKGDKREV